MTEDEKDDYNCEMSVYSEKKFTNIETFKQELSKEIIKDSRHCKCDTLFVDIDDLFDMYKKDKYHIWAVCKSSKLKINDE